VLALDYFIKTGKYKMLVALLVAGGNKVAFCLQQICK
jgi:hypothetical protein